MSYNEKTQGTTNIWDMVLAQVTKLGQFRKNIVVRKCPPLSNGWLLRKGREGVQGDSNVSSLEIIIDTKQKNLQICRILIEKKQSRFSQKLKNLLTFSHGLA